LRLGELVVKPTNINLVGFLQLGGDEEDFFEEHSALLLILREALTMKYKV